MAKDKPAEAATAADNNGKQEPMEVDEAAAKEEVEAKAETASST